ncbi:acetyl-CoA carboxylase [Arcanobacterium hippocoleae]|uniref:Acetyl-CoA carboxylase n=1 Tax=Arcanobacterium hippocoleae TaxID=149017 RepID=A0ABU1T3M6_9ACTO|nr:acetyl-CoA carboxylase [Arcanobacterium hippocoleae]MDR6939466.1 hypothetical protein [Arcanobacterium hippocoleae]
MKAKEEKDTELTEVSVDESSPDEVQLPIVPVESDATPALPADDVQTTAILEPASASLDLTMPILEVLTDPTM